MTAIHQIPLCRENNGIVQIGVENTLDMIRYGATGRGCCRAKPTVLIKFSDRIEWHLVYRQIPRQVPQSLDKPNKPAIVGEA